MPAGDDHVARIGVMANAEPSKAALGKRARLVASSKRGLRMGAARKEKRN